jgi:lipid-binding SYLF domain-containing protein
MKKGGFILGGRYGKGLVELRRDEGKGLLGAASHAALGGGSFGLQIGAGQSTSMLVMHRDGIDSLLKNKFTDRWRCLRRSRACGSCGHAETDAYMKAKTRASHRVAAFSGLELKGAVLQARPRRQSESLWKASGGERLADVSGAGSK